MDAVKKNILDKSERKKVPIRFSLSFQEIYMISWKIADAKCPGIQQREMVIFLKPYSAMDLKINKVRFFQVKRTYHLKCFSNPEKS